MPAQHPPQRPSTFRRAAGLALAALLVVVAGCAPSQEQTIKNIDSEWADLSTRPTIDEALADHEALIARIRTTLTDTLGLTPWKEFAPPGRAGCGEAIINFDVSENGSTGSWSTTGLTPQQWPTAKAAVIAEAAENGFTTVEIIVEKPGQYDLAIQGPYGAILNFGSGERTVLDLLSGCHLIAGAVKPTSTPTP